MKAKELRNLSNKEREEKLLEMKKELLKIRGQIAVGTLPKSPGQVKAIRKSIARINFINSSKDGENKGGAKPGA
ncbi:MAG TPA: 50S ribosomal protein L29 [Candidatus Nanoarchaeia archaeon]|nr:50S ribosomal protein L29 [Candidatus Nanoarchaeia archaeon]